MTPADTVTAALRAPRADGVPALVAFMTAGYPHPARFGADLMAIAEVADVVEIGVPFSDPMADGVTIQRASREAIAAGVSLRWIFDALDALEERPAAPLVLMSYLNPLLAFGGRLADRAAAAGVSGFIVPDLPWEESEPLRAQLAPAGLALVQLVTPVTSDARLETLCRGSSGFVYAVTVTGITGGAAGNTGDMGAYLARVRAASGLPVCAGFGIATADQVAAFGRCADGVVVGTALIRALERGDDAAQFLRGLRPA